MADKIKVKVSRFVSNIISFDSLCFSLARRFKPNKNALLNKLIPTLLEVRKSKRNQIEDILINEYNREDGEKVYTAVSTVIDRVYFSDEELNVLKDYIWIRPSRETEVVYDEIKSSEIYITALEVSAYIRGLLNEYACLPQYKRQMLVFNKELSVFLNACHTHQIVHFTEKSSGVKRKAFAFKFIKGYIYGDINYCVIYDIVNETVGNIPLWDIRDIYTIKQKFKPNTQILELLQEHTESCDFQKETKVTFMPNTFEKETRDN